MERFSSIKFLTFFFLVGFNNVWGGRIRTPDLLIEVHTNYHWVMLTLTLVYNFYNTYQLPLSWAHKMVYKLSSKKMIIHVAFISLGRNKSFLCGWIYVLFFSFSLEVEIKVLARRNIRKKKEKEIINPST